MTPYVFWKCKNSNLEPVHKFDSPPYILDVKETKGRFILMSNENKIIDLRYRSVGTQLAYIFTKGLDAARLQALISLVGLYVL